MSESDLDLDAIDARANAASPEPWTYADIESIGGGTIYEPEVSVAAIHWDNVDTRPIRRPIYDAEADRNGEFIAHARTDVPALVAEVRRLRAWPDWARNEASQALHCPKCGGPWPEGYTEEEMDG